jgi:DNA-directed RNA polymerase beta subunit
MRPFLEQGRCAVFVGTAHMLNLRHMIAEAGFSIRSCR